MMSPGVMIFTFENMLYVEHWNLKIIWGQFSLFWIMNYLFQNDNNNKFITKKIIKTQHNTRQPTVKKYSIYWHLMHK